MIAAVVSAVGLGLVVGSLLPMTAYRLAVPMNEPPRTTCGGCGERMAGWVRLPARCDRCRAWWGPRPWSTALAAGAASGLAAWWTYDTVAWPLYVVMAIFGVLLGAIDLACKRLPHDLVVPATAVAALSLTGLAAATGAWPDLLRAGLGGLALGGVFALLYLLPGQSVGFGDVKLAVLLGGLLGWLGWREVVLGALLPWLLNGPVVLVLLVAGRVDRKSTLPFGPALLGGCLLAIGVSEWIAVVGRL